MRPTTRPCNAPFAKRVLSRRCLRGPALVMSVSCGLNSDLTENKPPCQFDHCYSRKLMLSSKPLLKMIFLVLLVFCSVARADMTIEIVGGGSARHAIAVVPFKDEA